MVKPKNAEFGHGLLLCPNEVSMNMAKLAFASTVRVQDAAGVDRIPFMKEISNETLITADAAKDNHLTYTHFFRLPTRLQ